MYLIKGGLTRLTSFPGCESRYVKTDILISGNTITKIAADIDEKDAVVIDASDKIVIPGLVNAHLHSHDNFNKAWLENMPLEIWMPVVRPFFSGVRHTPDQVYYRTILGAMEMLHSGTTSVMDDVLLNGITDEECLDAIVRAYEDIGMRAVVCPHTKNITMEKTIPYADELFTDRMKEAICVSFPPEEDIIGFMEDSMNRYNRTDALATVGLSISAPMRSTQKMMEGFRDLSLKYNVPVSCHMLETYVQKCTGPMFFGKTLVRYMYDLGLLNENMVLIHCNWITEKDLKLMENSGCTAVHNPACNLRMGSGVAPIREMLEKIPVGLGTDNMSANDSANIFDAMKIGCLISKLRTPDYTRWLTAKDMFRMETFNGSRCLKKEQETGIIAEGMKADITILNAENEQYVMSDDPDMVMTYSENGSSVDTVIVDGKIVLQDGRLVTIDEKSVLEHLKEIRKEIRKEHDLAWKESEGVKEIFAKCYKRCNSTRL